MGETRSQEVEIDALERAFLDSQESNIVSNERPKKSAWRNVLDQTRSTREKVSTSISNFFGKVGGIGKQTKRKALALLAASSLALTSCVPADIDDTSDIENSIQSTAETPEGVPEFGEVEIMILSRGVGMDISGDAYEPTTMSVYVMGSVDDDGEKIPDESIDYEMKDAGEFMIQHQFENARENGTVFIVDTSGVSRTIELGKEDVSEFREIPE